MASSFLRCLLRRREKGFHTGERETHSSVTGGLFVQRAIVEGVLLLSTRMQKIGTLRPDMKGHCGKTRYALFSARSSPGYTATLAEASLKKDRRRLEARFTGRCPVARRLIAG